MAAATVFGLPLKGLRRANSPRLSAREPSWLAVACLSFVFACLASGLVEGCERDLSSGGAGRSGDSESLPAWFDSTTPSTAEAVETWSDAR